MKKKKMMLDSKEKKMGGPSKDFLQKFMKGKMKDKKEK